MDQGNSTIYISLLMTVVFVIVGVVLYRAYNKTEKFDYEPQELEDRGKELLDLPEQKLTDDEYKLQLQKVYPYIDKEEEPKMSVEGTDE